MRASLPLSVRRLLGVTRERWMLVLNGTQVDVRRQPDEGLPVTNITRFDMLSVRMQISGYKTATNQPQQSADNDVATQP